MSMGYMGWADVAGNHVLVTSGSGPITQTRLDSSGAWGGEITSDRKGIGGPRAYDYSVNDGSISFELSAGIAGMLQGLIRMRSTPFKIDMHPSATASTTFDEVWWTSIGFSASEGGAATADISFMALEGARQYSGTYYAIREGSGPKCELGRLLPFWATTVTGSVTGGMEVMSWSVSFSQDIQKIFQCGATGKDAQPPIILGFGPMMAELQLTLFVNGNFFPGNDNGSATVSLYDSVINLSQLKCMSISQDIVGSDDVSIINATYQAYNYA